MYLMAAYQIGISKVKATEKHYVKSLGSMKEMF